MQKRHEGSCWIDCWCEHHCDFFPWTVTVADYISRAESQSRQRNPPKETVAKTKKETAKDAIDENSPSEKAVNGPATTSGDEPSKLQHSPDEKKVTVQEDGNNQEEAVLNGVS